MKSQQHEVSNTYSMKSKILSPSHNYKIDESSDFLWKTKKALSENEKGKFNLQLILSKGYQNP